MPPKLDKCHTKCTHCLYTLAIKFVFVSQLDLDLTQTLKLAMTQHEFLSAHSCINVRDLWTGNFPSNQIMNWIGGYNSNLNQIRV